MSGKKQQVQNPWGLTFSQVDVLDTLCKHGTRKHAAAQLHITVHAFDSHLRIARIKMGQVPPLSAALLWDRWRQGEGKGVPA